MAPSAEPSGGVDVETDEAFFEKFEYLGALGEGGFSAIAKAKRTADGVLVALKMTEKKSRVVIDGPNGDVWAADQEARIWRMIRHPNVVALLSVHNLPDYVVLSTELCTGGNLLERLEGVTDFVQEDQAQRLACQVVTAVLYLHSIGVAHRDLKASNVLCTSAGAIEKTSVKVADFGLATSFDPGRAAMFQRVVGTSEYMAPELVAGSAYDETVDLWAVGCLIYELLSGKPPFFSEKNPRKTKQLILSAPLEFPPVVFGNISDEALDLMRRLLDRTPAARPAGNELAGHAWIASLVEVRRSVDGLLPVMRGTDDDAARQPKPIDYTHLPVDKPIDKLAPVVLCGARSSAGPAAEQRQSSGPPGRVSSNASGLEKQSERGSGLTGIISSPSSQHSIGRLSPPASPTLSRRRFTSDALPSGRLSVPSGRLSVPSGRLSVVSGRLSVNRQEDAKEMGEMRRAAMHLGTKQTRPRRDAERRPSLIAFNGFCAACAACFPR